MLLNSIRIVNTQYVVYNTLKTHLTSVCSSYLQAALIRDQKKYEEDEPRSAHLIEDITEEDIDGVSIKLDSVRFDQTLVEAYDLNPEQSYPFAKKSDEDVLAKEVKACKKDLSKNVKHISKSDAVKSKKSVVKQAGKTHGKPTVSEVQKKNQIEKERAKPDPVVEKKCDVEGGPETAPVVEEIPVNVGFNAEFEKCMNVDVGPKTVPVVDTSDIEKYCIETGE
ncbi:hypothetical protein HanRHA438_Chr06g0264071 [Helianthus annuus]|nr:hypothetical protein HanHA300_Chr06g0209181 [Helianthus annuus]KAJ0573236.1 hypothetical protein HanHA89_Chr06g0224541 [Helianthus annuus]KAJ0911519.1 hypothetical protein HanRHA438_Chr06g0264071 [Helianthus annuus]KAJ0915078.1 hypothetical protein HanPSC8_Chr06g0245851 [Helianthus annuus]